MSLRCIQGDITTFEADAIVNAANSGLVGGGGVDGAIHRAGGPAIMQECDAIRARQGGCPTGEAVITTAGKLKARYVIHTVGPVWTGDTTREDALLANAYRNSLAVAATHKVTSIAFPSISTGVYRFPKPRAAEIAVREVKAFVQHHPMDVTFVCFDAETLSIYQKLLQEQSV